MISDRHVPVPKDDGVVFNTAGHLVDPIEEFLVRQLDWFSSNNGRGYIRSGRGFIRPGDHGLRWERLQFEEFRVLDRPRLTELAAWRFDENRA